MTADPPGHIYLSIKQQSGFRRSSERRMVDLKAPLLLHFGAFVGEVLCLGCHRVSSLDTTQTRCSSRSFTNKLQHVGTSPRKALIIYPSFPMFTKFSLSNIPNKFSMFSYGELELDFNLSE